MIVTRNWLQEVVDITDINTDQLVKTLNSIGFEVAEVQKINLPKNVVVGRVVSCQKHPNADKLNVCSVDVGDEKLQIVCGAKNVQQAEYVAVAKIGAVLPDGLEIKPVKLRGVDSFGMICSSSELGLPELEKGIMILDHSIGRLEVGKELREYKALQDEIIDIELTANRGDCLSILGIAREIAAAYGRSVKGIYFEDDESIQIGIGRILNVEAEKDLDANLIYKAFEARKFSNPLLIRLRVAITGEQFTNEAEEFAYYISHTTGVIFRLYGYRTFASNHTTMVINKDEWGFEAVYGKEKASIIGVYQFDSSKPKKEDNIFIMETSYIEPEIITKKVYNTPIKTDWSYYRSSRGSEPRLGIALDYAKQMLHKFFADVMLYSGSYEIRHEIERASIKVDFADLDALIGFSINRNQIVEILKALGFTIVSCSEELMVVKAPLFRHDIFNIQDIAEEIVRIYGIDNIEPKPLQFIEQNRLNKAYEDYIHKKSLRTRAVAAGYFETVSYIFCNSMDLQKFGLPRIKRDLDILNPITNEMNTLRTSLIPNLLEQVARNIKNGKKGVKLFEIGTIFDENRRESISMAMVASGIKEPESIINGGKPAMIDIASFVEDLGRVIGDFSLKNFTPTIPLIHPYQAATIIKDEQEIGRVYKLHLSLQEELELPDTFIAEIDVDKLKLSFPKAKPYSIYQMAFRDLSVLVDKDLSYEQIQNVLQKRVPSTIKRFYPVAIYEDEQFGNRYSLTIRFAVQSDEKTLSEEEIGDIMQNVLDLLRKEFNAELR